MMKLLRSILFVKSSNGVIVEIKISNYFQDVTFKSPNETVSFVATGSELKRAMMKIFPVEDHAKILNLILEFANDEMKQKLVFE